MEKNKKKYGLLVAVALCVCLLGGFLANLAQTDFGKVTKKTILFESNSGHTISADVLIPNEAGEENPLPAIVWAHGGNANKERSDNFQIEWARRGYVVVSFDLYGHGESEVLNDTEWFDNGRGLYDTVQYVATLPYVDADRIAVSGHSRGGNTIHESVLLDNELETPLIKAILYVGRDAIYRDNETASFGYFPGKTNTTQAAEKGGNGEYFNYYGNRDVGIIADKYDDFSFKEKDEKTGEMKPNPEFLKSNNAKSFLNFGITPDEKTEDGLEGQWYEQEIDGKTAKRIIYMPLATHGTSVYVPDACTDAVEFMQTVIPTDSTLKADNHIFPLKTLGCLMGFAGFFVFVTGVALLLVQYEPFKGVSADRDATMRLAANDKKGKIWLTGCLLVNTVFPLLSALVLFHFKVDKVVDGFFMQGMPLFYGVWGTVNAIFVILTTIIWYNCYAKKNGISLDSIDMRTSAAQIGKTIATALVVTAAAPAGAATSPVTAPKAVNGKATVKGVTVKTSKKGTATVTAVKSKKATVKVAATIKVKGVTYKVTAIGANAFKNCKKVKKISVGKNVKTIGKNAFKGCKKLKTITLANKKVTIKKGAFAGLNTKKITVKAPKMSKKALKKFKKALKKAGFKGKVK